MAGRPQLAAALDDLDTGDKLVIAEWDRATRSMRDGLQIVKAVVDAGAVNQGARPQLYRPHHPYGAGFHGDDVGNSGRERVRIIKRSHKANRLPASIAAAKAARSSNAARVDRRFA